MTSLNRNSSQDYCQTSAPVSVSNDVKTAMNRNLSSALKESEAGFAKEVWSTNACGVLSKHCRLFSDHLAVWSSKFDPPLHFGLHKKEARVGNTSKSVLSITESSLSDGAEESVSFKRVRTRKLSDIHDVNYSNPAVRNCTDCETTEFPTWRAGFIRPKTFWNGRIFPDRWLVNRPTFEPSLHFNFPKKVQKMGMGCTGETDLNSNAKSKKFKDMRMGDNSEMCCNFAFDPKNVNEKGFVDINQRIQKGTPRPNRLKQMTETASTLLQLEFSESSQDFDSVMIPEQKLQPNVVKKCLHCESTETSLWREGPMGRGTLCNACGIQYRKNRLLPAYRPRESPTYDPSLHSCRSKKVQTWKMGNTNENSPILNFKSKIVEEIKLGENREMDKHLTSEQERVTPLGDTNECNQNHALSAKKFQEMTEKGSSLFEQNIRMRDQNINSESALKQLEPLKMVKKCQHCEATETLHWREGPKGRLILCNVCVSHNKFGKKVPDYCSLKFSRSDPSLHSCSPKKVQHMIVGYISEKGSNHSPKLEKVEQTRMTNSSEMAKKRVYGPEICKKNKKSDCEIISNSELPPEKVRKCLHCESSKTTLWRMGPMGRKTLCNACGIQFRYNRLFPEYRPKDSPTYDTTLHSHLPKKVMEIRMRNAEKCAGATSCSRENPV